MGKKTTSKNKSKSKKDNDTRHKHVSFDVDIDDQIKKSSDTDDTDNINNVLNKSISYKKITAKYKMCLNMIVKNESHIIEQTLSNMKKYIDYWVICDTGSTDGTQQIIIDYFAKENIPGELVQHQWKNFGYNRSLSLRECYNKSDYVWITDADDLVVGDFKFPKNMRADAYNLKYDKAFVYTRTQIIKNRGLEWRYMGVLHEYIECINKKDLKYELLEGDYYIDSRRLGARNNDPLKYKKDADLLVNEIEKYPNSKLNERYCFYAAQSFFDYKDFENAIKYYKKRIEYKGWYEEVFYSYLRVAISTQILNNNKESEELVTSKFLEAFNYVKNRSEPLHCLGVYLKNIKEYEKAYDYLKQAVVIPYPVNQSLFVTKPYYDYETKYEFANVCCESKKHDESNKYCDELLSLNTMPSHVYQLVENLKYKNMMVQYEDVVYDRRIINIIDKFSKSSTKNNLTLSIVINKYELFENTINSFIKCCKDISMIDKWLCIANNLSDVEIEIIKEQYPFLIIIVDDENTDNDMVKSMNKIIELVDTPYLLHMGDNYKFFNKQNYIKPALEIFNQDKIMLVSDIPASQNIDQKKICQVLFNKNYMETPNHAAYGGFLAELPNKTKYVVHEHYVADTPEYTESIKKYNGPTSIYWPHFSLRPSVIKTEIFKEIGEFTHNNGFYERNYADRFYAKNYISVFYNTLSHLVIK
jgi:tetratricopeptide (TPR) repeat protein